MNKNEELKELKSLYAKMQEFKFPKFPKNEILANWMDSIFELDPYYAGWALTVAEGGKISLRDLYDIKELKKYLNSIQIDNEEDLKILEECKCYLKILEQVDELLHKLSR